MQMALTPWRGPNGEIEGWVDMSQTSSGTPSDSAAATYTPASPQWSEGAVLAESATLQGTAKGTSGMNAKGGLIVGIALVLASVLAFGQSDNMIHVKTFPGTTVGAKVANAMATCNTSGGVPCILVVDASLAASAPGTMPTLCAKCTVLDYRSGSSGLPGVSAKGGMGINFYSETFGTGNPASAFQFTMGGNGQAGGGGGGPAYGCNSSTFTEYCTLNITAAPSPWVASTASYGGSSDATYTANTVAASEFASYITAGKAVPGTFVEAIGGSNINTGNDCRLTIASASGTTITGDAHGWWDVTTFASNGTYVACSVIAGTTAVVNWQRKLWGSIWYVYSNTQNPYAQDVVGQEVDVAVPVVSGAGNSTAGVNVVALGAQEMQFGFQVTGTGGQFTGSGMGFKVGYYSNGASQSFVATNFDSTGFQSQVPAHNTGLQQFQIWDATGSVHYQTFGVTGDGATFIAMPSDASRNALNIQQTSITTGTATTNAFWRSDGSLSISTPSASANTALVINEPTSPTAPSALSMFSNGVEVFRVNAGSGGTYAPYFAGATSSGGVQSVNDGQISFSGTSGPINVSRNTADAIAVLQIANNNSSSTGLLLDLVSNTTHVASISNAGRITGTAFYAGASAGVTCSGTPTSSFSSANGIVTHC